MAVFRRFVKTEAGQDLIEFGLIVGVVTAVLVATVTNLSSKILSHYTTVCTSLGGC